MLRRWWAIVLLLPLGACGDSKERGSDLAECRTEAIKVYPNWRTNNLGLDMGDFTFLCMKSKGYVASDACPLGSGWEGEIEEKCYRKE